jgi:serine/threonine protein kinase
MEYVEGTNLLKNMMSRQRNEKTVRDIMQKLLTGLEYLHSLGIAHRDIKFENIIVD